MAYKYDLKPALEGSNAYVDEPLTGWDIAAAAIMGTIFTVWGFISFKDWLKERKEAKKPENIAQKLVETIKPQNIIKMFDELKKLDDKKFNEIFSVEVPEVFNFSPENPHADLTISARIVDFTLKFIHPLRMKLVNCKPEEIARETGTFKQLRDSLYQQIADVEISHPACKGKIYNAPKDIAKFVPGLNKVSTGKTFLDIGWNKNTLEVLKNHIVYHFIDLPKREYDFVHEDREYFAACRKNFKAIMIAEGYWDDWDGTDEEKIESCADDDGLSAYIFGQDPGWFLENPYGLGDLAYIRCKSLHMIIYIISKNKELMQMVQKKS